MDFTQIKTWLFDLDGTLIDSNSAVVECMKKTALDMGGEVTDEQVLRSSFGRGLMNTIGPWVPAGKVDEALKKYLENFPRYVQANLRMYQGALELLELLKSRQMPMAVITGNMQAECDGIYEKLDLAKYFPVTICADTIPFQKPSPEPVLEALKRLGQQLEGAVFIGDSEHDIRAGRLAGVITIAVRGGSSTEEKLTEAGPDLMLDGVWEIIL